jgi:hypothetical protein
MAAATSIWPQRCAAVAGDHRGLHAQYAPLDPQPACLRQTCIAEPVRAHAACDAGWQQASGVSIAFDPALAGLGSR